MNKKISVWRDQFQFEEIIYLLFYSLHYCTLKLYIRRSVSQTNIVFDKNHWPYNWVISIPKQALNGTQVCLRYKTYFPKVTALYYFPLISTFNIKQLLSTPQYLGISGSANIMITSICFGLRPNQGWKKLVVCSKAKSYNTSAWVIHLMLILEHDSFVNYFYLQKIVIQTSHKKMITHPIMSMSLSLCAFHAMN